MDLANIINLRDRLLRDAKRSPGEIDEEIEITPLQRAKIMEWWTRRQQGDSPPSIPDLMEHLLVQDDRHKRRGRNQHGKRH